MSLYLKRNSIYSDETWSITLNNRQIAYLSESSTQGISRWEAYLDLLNHVATTSVVIEPEYNPVITLWPGQLLASITELATRWRWARITVRSYLARLEEFELIRRIQLNRCSIIAMTMVFPFLSPDDLGVVDTPTDANGSATPASDLEDAVVDSIEPFTGFDDESPGPEVGLPL